MDTEVNLNSAGEHARPHFIMFGGFLGAGKTTIVLKFAKWLKEEKRLRVGVLTNDQGEGLVDTTLARGASFATAEVAGGCFCCRSDELVRAAAGLTAEIAPEVFIAEPVGSCADLIATVSIPLVDIYKTNFIIAPLTVLLDPFRASRLLSSSDSAGGGSLPSSESAANDIDYIFRKQLEEAEIIALNKVDIISEERRTSLKRSLSRLYPHARIIEISARHGRGLSELFDILLTSEMHTSTLMEMDYDRYGRGEAHLGWLNATYSFRSLTPTDGNELLSGIAAAIKAALDSSGILVAHAKLAIHSVDNDSIDLDPSLAVIQWVCVERPPEMTVTLPSLICEGRLIINIRAQGDPDAISRAVMNVIAQIRTLEIKLLQGNHFSPPQPNPTYRAT